MDPRLVALVAVALVAPAMAGCASKDAPDQGQPTTNRASPPAANPGGTVDATPPPPKPASARWHFHDYWKGQPTITLFDGNVTLNATVGHDGLPALSHVFTFPNGVVVPAETGLLTVNVTWDAAAPGGGVNVTFKPADSNGFFGVGNVTNGEPAQITTTESMCDVPHRQESLWKLNFTAVPEGTPPTLPPRDLRVNITATIGRPLFIDPPHVNWWLQGETLTLVEEHKGEVVTAATAAGNLSLTGSAPNLAPAPAEVRVPADEGRIVPEGAKTVLVMLNWTSQAPNQKLTVRYREGNLPSEGPMQLVQESGASRVFAIDVMPPMTDTTYSNRTTWEFRVLPDGQTPAFQGTFTLVAWTSQLHAAEALRAVAGG